MERRAGERAVPGLILTETDREILRDGRIRGARCGQSYLELHRLDLENGPAKARRRLVPVTCGRRACRPCDIYRRQIEADRLIGPWRTLVTLTWPRTETGLRETWRGASKAASRWCARLRDAVRRDPARFSCKGDLEYAWVLEHHEDGWPHVHIVVSAAWIPWEWARRTWARIIRLANPFVMLKQVWNKDGICKYLVPYLAKDIIPEPILAVLYRRRLWASTIATERGKHEGWEVSKTHLRASISDQIADPYRWAAENGWTVVWTIEGQAAEWARPVSELEEKGQEAFRALVERTGAKPGTKPPT